MHAKYQPCMHHWYIWQFHRDCVKRYGEYVYTYMYMCIHMCIYIYRCTYIQIACIHVHCKLQLTSLDAIYRVRKCLPTNDVENVHQSMFREEAQLGLSNNDYDGIQKSLDHTLRVWQWVSYANVKIYGCHIECIYLQLGLLDGPWLVGEGPCAWRLWTLPTWLPVRLDMAGWYIGGM